MTVAELLALPVGTRLRWDVMDTAGVVVKCRGRVVRVAWNDGQIATFRPDDEGITEYADTLEIDEADQPLVIDATRRHRMARDTRADTR
jgi:hypothetical protein